MGLPSSFIKAQSFYDIMNPVADPTKVSTH